MRTQLLMVLVLALLTITGVIDPATAMMGGMVLQTAPASGAAAILAGGTAAVPAAVVVPPVQGAVGAGAPAAVVAPAAGAANDISWLGDGLSDELKGYATNKGWKAPKDLLEGYFNLEKAMGSHRLALPKDEKDEAGWGKVFDAMGRPRDAAAYKLPVPEGTDPKFAGVAGETMHKLGLTTKQATGLATWWNEQAATAQKTQLDARVAKSAEEETALRAHWGGAWDQNLAIGKRGAATFGIDMPMMEKLDAALGTRGTLELLHRIGAALGEHQLAGAENNDPARAGGAMTPEQAQAEIKRLNADAEWTKKYLAGGADENARMAQLFKWGYPT